MRWPDLARGRKRRADSCGGVCCSWGEGVRQWERRRRHGQGRERAPTHCDLCPSVLSRSRSQVGGGERQDGNRGGPRWDISWNRGQAQIRDGIEFGQFPGSGWGAIVASHARDLADDHVSSRGARRLIFGVGSIILPMASLRAATAQRAKPHPRTGPPRPGQGQERAADRRTSPHPSPQGSCRCHDKVADLGR